MYLHSGGDKHFQRQLCSMYVFLSFSSHYLLYMLACMTNMESNYAWLSYMQECFSAAPSMDGLQWAAIPVVSSISWKNLHQGVPQKVCDCTSNQIQGILHVSFVHFATTILLSSTIGITYAWWQSSAIWIGILELEFCHPHHNQALTSSLALFKSIAR